jgi:hypothetical protein
MNYNTTEQETIGLCVCLEAVGNVANHGLIELRDVSSLPGESEVYFHTHVHEQLFLIRLTDFVKEGGDSRLMGIDGSCLEVLQSACTTKSFNTDGSIEGLKKSVEELDKWLNYRAPITLWLPTLDINATVQVSRLDFLRISGNQSKHNLSRLTGVSRNVAKILNDNGYAVTPEHIPLALDDFREHLEENFFIYYGTWIAELMNNIRWGLQTYLNPVFLKSFRSKGSGSIMYTYEYPNEIQNEVARQWFWRLMNHIRTRPYLKKFVGAHYLKKQSSLEWGE